MTYLLDSNARIEVLNRPKGNVAARFTTHPPAASAYNSVTHAELALGAFKTANPQFKLASVHA